MLGVGNKNEYGSVMSDLRKPVRTRDPDAKYLAIIKAGEYLFSAKGFERTKMSDIANRADVSVGTLYRLFPDKPSLLAALHRQMEDGFINAMQSGWSRGDTYPDRFDYLIESLLDELIRVRETMPLYMMTKNIVGAANHQPGMRVMNEIQTLYQKAVSDGAARAFPDGYQAAIGHAIIEGAFRAWLMEPTEMRRSIVQQETQDLLKRAFQIA